MFTGKGNSTNSANSAKSNDCRLVERGLINTNNNDTRLGEIIKRNPECAIIMAAGSRSAKLG